MKKIFNFGETVEGYSIPVLNAREIRAGAGIMFALMFVAYMLAIRENNFWLIKYAIMVFFTDMAIRVLINPRFSPILIVGRFMVNNQFPEYVGAPQKRFAWSLGLILSGTVFSLLTIGNSFSPITGIICMICVLFLFFETAFGICLGCKFYPLIFKKKARVCPGEVCEVKQRQEVQKVSGLQKLAVFGFVVYLFSAGFFLNEYFSQKPYDLFGITQYVESLKEK